MIYCNDDLASHHNPKGLGEAVRAGSGRLPVDTSRDHALVDSPNKQCRVALTQMARALNPDQAILGSVVAQPILTLNSLAGNEGFQIVKPRPGCRGALRPLYRLVKTRMIELKIVPADTTSPIAHQGAVSSKSAKAELLEDHVRFPQTVFSKQAVGFLYCHRCRRPRPMPSVVSRTLGHLGFRPVGARQQT